MARRRTGRTHYPPQQGGKPKPKKDAPPEKLPARAPNRSWQPGRKGQGGEGFSQGYGGSGGFGTGPSGPDQRKGRQKDR
jgi:hypothetical protein